MINNFDIRLRVFKICALFPDPLAKVRRSHANDGWRTGVSMPALRGNAVQANKLGDGRISNSLVASICSSIV